MAVGRFDLTRSHDQRSLAPEVTIHSLGAGGVGVGHLPDGRTVFVPRTAPGDRAVIGLVREKRRWCQAEVLKLLEKGPGRQEPPCSLYSECHGCALQHLAYHEQLRWKGRIVADCLERIGGYPTTAVTVEPSPDPLHYRDRLTFTLRRLGGGRVVAGFRYRTNPGRVMDLRGECLLPRNPLMDSWLGLRRAWGPDAVRLPEGRELRLTLSREGEQSSLLIRGGRGEGDPDALVKDTPSLASVFREEKGGGVRHLAGDTAFLVPWLGETLDLSRGGFVQVNRDAGQALHQYVLSEADGRAGMRIIEAYCGFGVMGRILARSGATVLGVEADPAAAGAARTSRVPGFRMVEGRVEDVLASHLPADLVILNPPRAGLDRKVPGMLGQGQARRVIYVSCDPATLARDLSRMGSRYRILGLRAFDLFPQTAHVETVVTLETTGG